MRKIGLVLLLISVSIILVGGFGTVIAAPEATATIDVELDTFIDIVENNVTHDTRTLQLANSTPPGGGTDTPTKVVYLRFDLSSVNFTIDKARLNLSTYTCGNVGGGAATVEVLGVSDTGNGSTNDWDQGALTWDNAPTTTTSPLIELSIPAADQSRVSWEDNGPGSNPLPQWLESQRTGDGFATLVLRVKDGSGLTTLRFEDSELSATNFIGDCSDAGLRGPVLQLADASDPLAVNFYSFRSGGTADFAMIGLGLLVAVGLLVGTGYTVANRRRG